MEVPETFSITTEEQLNLVTNREFKLLVKENTFLTSIGKSSILEYFGLRIKELSLGTSYYYENFYSLEELQNINKYFRIFDNIDEVISFIEEIFVQKKASLKLENNKIFLTLKIHKIDKGEETISLGLKKKNLSMKEICENLLKEIQSLKIKFNEIEEIKNEIKILKEKNELKELKDEIRILKEEIQKKDIIMNELITWKKQNEENQNKVKLEENKNKIEIKQNKEINYEMSDEELARKLQEEFNKYLENNIINEIGIDSLIIEKNEELELISNRLKKIKEFKNKNIAFKLIYRGTRDGCLAKDFHKKCDGINKTITLIKTIKGVKFGGYISKNWDSHSNWIKDDEECFVFSLNYMKIYNSIKGQTKYFFKENCGPVFSEFGVRDNLFQISSLNIKKVNEANKRFTGFSKDYEINCGEKEFQVEELEVFHIIIE